MILGYDLSIGDSIFVKNGSVLKTLGKHEPSIRSFRKGIMGKTEYMSVCLYKYQT